ncbi:hypothetical protein RHGRI_021022 [Rhododendron griersonianum]|uniref:Small ribosomal subunit protein uS14c n=1 Tax=Rhododendron griersonianum TaxID=479676 RepID=A0AAV6JN47_9ERIC|nr:hypothetical protein RHGRI_021022 [Rhododendron griersonianum]
MTLSNPAELSGHPSYGGEQLLVGNSAIWSRSGGPYARKPRRLRRPWVAARLGSILGAGPSSQVGITQGLFIIPILKILRRSASAIAPLANRLIATQNHHHSSPFFSSITHTNHSPHPPRTPFPSVLHYSSTPKEPSKVSEKRNIQDHNRRQLAAKYEQKRNLYKALCKDPGLPAELRERYRYKLSKLPRNSSFGRVRNRCIYTGRPRSVYKLFRMSRIVFRGLASRGALMGVKKSSW